MTRLLQPLLARSFPLCATILLGALGATSAAAQDSWGTELESKLKASDASAGVNLGEAIDVSGDRAAVSRLNWVYVYERQGGTWVEVARLDDPGGTPANQFAHSVAISGDVLVAGAWLDDTAANDHGAAFVYERDAGGNWNFVTQLTASDAGAGDHYGWSIDADGDLILVGSDEDNHSGFNNAGSAYVYRKVAGIWVEEAKLIANDPGSSDLFAWSVSIRGDVAACGTLNDDDGGNNSGSAYVFRHSAGTWTQEDKLVSSDLAAQDSFGYDVAIDGDTAVVGAPGDDDGGSGSGSAYVFEQSGGSWNEVIKLVSDAPAGNQSFGRSVALAGDLAAAGAMRTSVNGNAAQGAAHLFRRESGGWAQVLRATASDGDPSDFLGRSVALDGTRLAGTAHGDDDVALGSGAGYLFDVIPVLANYCSSSSNSTGGPALMTWSGSTSVARNDLVLIATSVPNQSGLFYYGSNPIDLPFGNGRRCVGGGIYHLSVTVAIGNELVHALDITDPPAVGGQILAGSRWHFQAWFRDPMGGGSAFDLSDGLEALFVP